MRGRSRAVVGTAANPLAPATPAAIRPAISWSRHAGATEMRDTEVNHFRGYPLASVYLDRAPRSAASGHRVKITML